MRPRSISPSGSVVALPSHTGFATNSSVASSLEIPSGLQPQMGMAGMDIFGSGRANFGSCLPLAASAVASTPLFKPTVMQLHPRAASAEDPSLKLQDAQVWFQGHRAPLAALVQDTVTQQFLKIKESMDQEVQRCVQVMSLKTNMCDDLLQRLEAERSRGMSSQSTLVGLRHDFDRQQAQISELVQSRLSTSAVQAQSLRERDEELSLTIENLRRDVEGIRNQNRNSLAGNVATSDQQQRVEKAYLEVRRDIEVMTADIQRNRNAQTKTEKTMAEMRKKPAEDKGLQLVEISQQLAMQQQYQQQVERVVLELRKDLQGSIDIATSGLRVQKDRADEQQKITTEQQKRIADLQGSLKIAVENVNQHWLNIVELKSIAEGNNNIGEAALTDFKRQMETAASGNQMLSASFGADLLTRVEKTEENFRRTTTLADQLQRLQREVEQRANHTQEMSKHVSAESTARIDLTQSLDAYRSAHLQTSSELRDAMMGLQERVAYMENCQLEDRGLRERTMGFMEVNLQDLMNVTQLERDARLLSASDSARRTEELDDLKRDMKVESAARVEVVQSLEAFRTAHLETSSDIRKDIEIVSETCGTLQGFMDQNIQDITQMIQVESNARVDLSGSFVAHRARSDAKSDDSLGRIEIMELEFKESQQVLSSLCDEEAMRASELAQYNHSRTELHAETELLMDKLGRLESQCEETNHRHAQAIGHHEKGLVELRKLIVEGMGAETIALRGGLENMNSSLQAAVVDLEVEQSRRAQEFSALQSEIQVLRSQLSQLEAWKGVEESNVQELRSSLVEVTKEEERINESVISIRSAVKAEVEVEKVVMAKEASQIQSGMRIMEAKLAGLETAANEDRGWRVQAVQDLEGILGEIKHITPTAASARTLPTLASALRQCKAESAAEQS